jgi:hypothetical protein
LYDVVDDHDPRHLQLDQLNAVSLAVQVWPRLLSMTRKTNVVLFRHALIVLPFGIAAIANPPTTTAVSADATTAGARRDLTIRANIPSPNR